MTSHRTQPLLSILALVAALSPTLPQTSFAQTADPGARAGDREMTCADVSREREQIMATINAPAAPARSSGFGRGLMGLARSVASVAAPAVVGGLGGGSLLGTIAAQTAGQVASQAMSEPSVETSPPPVATPQLDADQQARLDRLSRIGAFRQCAG